MKFSDKEMQESFDLASTRFRLDNLDNSSTKTLLLDQMETSQLVKMLVVSTTLDRFEHLTHVIKDYLDPHCTMSLKEAITFFQLLESED